MAGGAGRHRRTMTPERLDRGIKAGIVPGNAGGLLTAPSGSGRSPLQCWRRQSTRARHAERAYRRAIRSASKTLAATPTSAAIFLPNGQPPREGEVFRNPALARTSASWSGRGAALAAGRSRAEAVRAYDRFYTGDIAGEIVRFARANGGVLDEADFRNFRAEWTEPLHTTYRGYDVYTTRPRRGRLRGGDAQPRRALRPRRHGAGSAESTHVLAEAIKVAKSDIYRYVAVRARSPSRRPGCCRRTTPPADGA